VVGGWWGLVMLVMQQSVVTAACVVKSNNQLHSLGNRHSNGLTNERTMRTMSGVLSWTNLPGGGAGHESRGARVALAGHQHTVKAQDRLHHG